MEQLESITQPYAVLYRDGWGEYAADRFATLTEARARKSYLSDRGRSCCMVDTRVDAVVR